MISNYNKRPCIKTRRRNRINTKTAKRIEHCYKSTQMRIWTLKSVLVSFKNQFGDENPNKKTERRIIPIRKSKNNKSAKIIHKKYITIIYYHFIKFIEKLVKIRNTFSFPASTTFNKYCYESQKFRLERKTQIGIQENKRRIKNNSRKQILQHKQQNKSKKRRQ